MIVLLLTPGTKCAEKENVPEKNSSASCLGLTCSHKLRNNLKGHSWMLDSNILPSISRPQTERNKFVNSVEEEQMQQLSEKSIKCN